VRLAAGHLVAGHDDPERLGRQVAQDRRDERGVGHRHQPAPHALLRERVEQLQGAGAPRHLVGHLGEHAVEQLVDDLLGAGQEPHPLLHVAAGVDEVVAHQLHGVVMGPRRAVLAGHVVLGLDPEGLGVDQSAVHVPQDGRGRVQKGLLITK
jgi:hypothetical protein